jgi:hypothetical protein
VTQLAAVPVSAQNSVMVNETSDDLFLDDGGIVSAMRAEAATNARSANNWVMAALITTNGGAILTLLSNADDGPFKIVALAIFMLGVTSALIAGRLSANVAHEAEAIFVDIIGLQRASLHSLRAARTGDPEIFANAQKLLQHRQESFTKTQADYDKAASPALWLGLGIVFFFFGCIVAGFALF